MPYAGSLGVELAGADAACTVGRLACSADRCTVAGMVHGGALMSLADSEGAVCAHLNLPPGAATSTIESKTNFVQAVRDDTVHATARSVHVGRAIIVVQTELTDPAGRPMAVTTQTQAMISPEPLPERDARTR
jgi:uncharacterized protein (TIGR00369 family)